MRDRGELSRDANPADIALAILTALQGGLLLSKGEKSSRPLEVAFEMALSYVAAHGPRAAAARRPSQAD
jgi:TetR/AcrR family transcriptional repressor of nem operon